MLAAKMHRRSPSESPWPLIGEAMEAIQAFLMLCASLTAFSAIGQSEFSKQTVADNPPFKLEITANLDNGHSNVWDFANSAQTVVKAGSMIVVAVRKTNISDHEIDKGSCVGDASGYRCGGHYDVWDSRGNLADPKKPRMSFIGGGPGHLIGTKDNVLQPGESNIDRGNVSEAFDISKPGTYTIQLWQHVANDPRSDEVRSNIITVTVLPVGGKPSPASKPSRNGEQSGQEPEPPADVQR
jgi:hypothetical protein